MIIFIIFKLLEIVFMLVLYALTYSSNFIKHDYITSNFIINLCDASSHVEMLVFLQDWPSLMACPTALEFY